MNPSVKENTYALLAFFLTPWKKPDDLNFLSLLIKSEILNWEELMYLANINLCTPLWYVSLKRDGLLKFIPEELQKYLQALYESNLERNNLLEEALIGLNKEFNENNISFILLKGGAALWDNLYGDPGARLLQDLDILVKPEDTDIVQQILFKFGFEEVPNRNMEFEGLATDSRHHHLKTLRKPGSPVVIEIHYRTGYAKAGELLPPHEAWANTAQIFHSGTGLHILNPTRRLIHNTVHGLIPQAEFIQGKILLQQLAEFAYIVKKYSSDINWQDWLATVKIKGFSMEFLAYLSLAKSNMAITIPGEIKIPQIAKLHAARILSTGAYSHYYKKPYFPLWQKIRQALFRFSLRSYYFMKLPAWVWQNVCYTEGGGNKLLRLKYFFKKALSPRSRAKI